MGNESGEPSVGGGAGGKKKMVKRKLEMAKSIIARYSKRPNLKSRRTQSKNNPSSLGNHTHEHTETGYTVDVAELLFTPERDFLVKNNGHKVRIDDLKGKNIVLYMAPLYKSLLWPEDTLDMIQAYNELLPLGGVEFVFVPISLPRYNVRIPSALPSQEAIFNYLFSTLPFPAVPFSDVESCGYRVVNTFSLDYSLLPAWNLMPYWVVIDHTSTVVATRFIHQHLFKLFGGAELHPLSLRRICALWDEFELDDDTDDREESRKQLINKWDQLLASPTRDFLLSSNGDQVPISSLKDKVIGLYFCENKPHHYYMEMINKVYQEAKSRGYDFEIVQINFHYYCFKTTAHRIEEMLLQKCNESVSWLTLPFKDPSCRKLQRIFKCDFKDDDGYSFGDCLVIIDPRQADTNGVLFEFSGAQILRKYGIEGYPFTRQHLYELEYKIQEKKVKLQSFFPPGLCHLIRPAGDGFDVTDGSQLTGKRVLVLFGKEPERHCRAFLSMLKSKYCEQVNHETEENKFEVVYVSDDWLESRFMESIKDMSWLVHPLSQDFEVQYRDKMMKASYGIGVAAFDMNGELIAKECYYDQRDTSYKLVFPFITQDWRERIRLEVGRMCYLYRYD